MIYLCEVEGRDCECIFKIVGDSFVILYEGL